MQYTKEFIRYLLSIVLFAFSTFHSVASAQQPAVSDGEIHGIIYRRGTEQPVVNATVRLTGKGQQTRTNENGEFRFSRLAASEYTLTVSATGYQLPEDERVITVKPAQTTEVKIVLEPVAFQLEEVKVTSTPSPPIPGKQTLEAREMKRIPGTAGDALRALGALPGINVANDFHGQLYIRGGAPEDNRFYLDRAPLFYPYHFGGLVSTINSEVLDRIDVYAGGFGAEFGADAQAVIDIYSRRGREDRLGGKFNLNLLYSDGLIEGPIGERGSWYLAGRRSYFDLLPINVDQITAFPRFWDYQAKLSYDLGEKHQLHFNAFAADDFMELQLGLEDVDNDPTLAGKFHFKDSFNVQGAHLRSTLTNRLTSNLSISRADYFQDLSFGQGLFLRLKPTQYELREDVTYDLTSGHQLESGVLLSTTEWDVSSFFPRPPDEGDPNAENIEYFTAEERVVSDFRQRYNFAEVYLQERYRPFPFLSLAVGLRLDYFNLTNRFSVGPRASLRLRIPSGSEIRLAVGRYDVSPYPWQIAPDFGNADVKESTALHYILELERQILPQTSLKVAGYQRDLSKLITRDPDAVYLNQGNGFSRGVEVSLNHRAGDRFFGWANYAYSVAKRKDNPFEPERLYSFDQTHVATLVGSYQLTRTWEIGAKWQYRTGNPYTPVTDARLVIQPNTGQPDYVPVYGETNSERVAPFHRLDIRVNKSFTFNRWQMGVFLEVLNVYNRKNVLSFDYNDDYSEQDTVYQLPLIPYLGITVEF